MFLCAHQIKLFFNNHVELEILMQLKSQHQRSVLRDLQTKRPAALRLLTSLPTVPSPEAWGVSLGFGWEAEPSVSMNICKVAQRTDTPPLPIIQQPNTWSLCWALEGPSSHSYESRVEACIWLCPSVWEHLEHWVLGHLPSLVIVK